MAVIDQLTTQIPYAHVDTRDYSMGWKLKDAELMGVPLCIIVGEREVDENVVTVKLRDVADKKSVEVNGINARIKQELDDMHDRLYRRAESFLRAHIVQVDSLDKLQRVVSEGNFAKAYFSCDNDDEAKFEEEFGFGTRCIDMDNTTKGTCIYTGKPTTKLVYFARSY